LKKTTVHRKNYGRRLFWKGGGQKITTAMHWFAGLMSASSPAVEPIR